MVITVMGALWVQRKPAAREVFIIQKFVWLIGMGEQFSDIYWP